VMSSFDDEDNVETTLVVIKTCYVYKIPVRTTTTGYRAADWDLSTPMWTGRCVVSSAGNQARVKLEDPNTGEIFAVCPVNDGSIEPVNDSSRYYAMKIEDGSGRHAFIGMGFQERNDAFDFSAALQDHAKFIKQKKESEENARRAATQPKVDYSLKDGQKIHVEFKTAKKSSPSSPTVQANSNFSGGLLPPPPSSSNRIKTNQPQQQTSSSFTPGSNSSLFDFDPSFNQNSFSSASQNQFSSQNQQFGQYQQQQNQQFNQQNQQFFQQNQFNQQNQFPQQNQFQTNEMWGDFTGSSTSPNIAPKASTQQTSNNMFDFFN